MDATYFFISFMLAYYIANLYLTIHIYYYHKITEEISSIFGILSKTRGNNMTEKINVYTVLSRKLDILVDFIFYPGISSTVLERVL